MEEEEKERCEREGKGEKQVKEREGGRDGG